MGHRTYSLLWAIPLLLAGAPAMGMDTGVHYQKDTGGVKGGVLAVYNGKRILSSELERDNPEVFAARMAYFKAQKAAIDDRVRREALEELAKKANLRVDEFLTREMVKAKTGISDAEIEKYLKQKNVPDPGKVASDVREQVRGLLHVQKLVAATTKGNPARLYLQRPALAASAAVKLEGEAALGAAGAPITLVEFGDFQCSYCGQARARIAELRKTYGPRLRFVFKHFPLSVHANARSAAEAGACVLEQGQDKFWKFYDIAFDNQRQIAEKDLLAHAQSAGADPKRFADCLASKKHAAKIDASIAEGNRLGITATPTFLVNGQLIKGTPTLAEFREVVEE